MMFKKILAPIDGSKRAHKALTTALEMARLNKSDLEILHVTSYIEEYVPTESESTGAPMSEESLSPPEWIDDYMAKVRKNDKKMLSQALKDAEAMYPELKVTSKLLPGRPGKGIVGEAEEGGFDLIVIGCRGLNGLAELVLGSVSHEVVNESKVPVLVVK
jgi:nucleotide-binding universal stress UspA family protein